MAGAREQVELFLKRCDDVIRSGFIIADTRISDLLKSIVSSDALYAFFKDATNGYDYEAAKRRYMNYTPPGSSRRVLLFPEDPAERLAFTFFILAEIDAKSIDLSAFLQEYFNADGSLHGSFYAFCNQVIKPFRNAVKTMFRGGAAAEAEKLGAVRAASALAPVIEAERKRVYTARIPDAVKVDALLLLNAAENSVSDPETLAGVLVGYLAFARGAGFGVDTVSKFSQALDQIKETL